MHRSGPSRVPEAPRADRRVAIAVQLTCPSPDSPASYTLVFRGRFVRLAGGEKRICEYNQEACRLTAFDGRKSLIRSFPCAALLSALPLHALPTSLCSFVSQFKSRGECRISHSNLVRGCLGLRVVERRRGQSRHGKEATESKPNGQCRANDFLEECTWRQRTT